MLSQYKLFAGFPLALLFAACATTPPLPPTEEVLQDKAKAEGPNKAYERYQVAVEGSACMGYDVKVGPEKQSAPARYYFDNAPFEVEHRNGWASMVSSGFLICGSVSMIPVAILSAVVDPVYALAGLVLCSIPLMLTAVPFAVIANWGMEDAATDYNAKLLQKLNATTGQSGANTTPPTPTVPSTETAADPAPAPAPTPETQPGAAPFSY